VGSMSLSIEGDMDLDKVRRWRRRQRWLGGIAVCGCGGLAGLCVDVALLLCLLNLLAQHVRLLCIDIPVSPPCRR
jgi:hypothetical protein